MAEFEHIQNLNLDQLKVLATSKCITDIASVTKSEFQVFVLSQISKTQTNELKLIQAKLQLID